jgi:hypothetical protein
MLERLLPSKRELPPELQRPAANTAAEADAAGTDVPVAAVNLPAFFPHSHYPFTAAACTPYRPGGLSGVFLFSGDHRYHAAHEIDVSSVRNYSRNLAAKRRLAPLRLPELRRVRD